MTARTQIKQQLSLPQEGDCKIKMKYLQLIAKQVLSAKLQHTIGALRSNESLSTIESLPLNGLKPRPLWSLIIFLTEYESGHSSIRTFSCSGEVVENLFLIRSLHWLM